MLVLPFFCTLPLLLLLDHCYQLHCCGGDRKAYWIWHYFSACFMLQILKVVVLMVKASVAAAAVMMVVVMVWHILSRFPCWCWHTSFSILDTLIAIVVAMQFGQCSCLLLALLFITTNHSISAFNISPIFYYCICLFYISFYFVFY